MAGRPYIRPEHLSRIPVEGMTAEEAGHLIDAVAERLGDMETGVALLPSVVDLAITQGMDRYREQEKKRHEQRRRQAETRRDSSDS